MKYKWSKNRPLCKIRKGKICLNLEFWDNKLNTSYHLTSVVSKVHEHSGRVVKLSSCRNNERKSKFEISLNLVFRTWSKQKTTIMWIRFFFLNPVVRIGFCKEIFFIFLSFEFKKVHERIIQKTLISIYYRTLLYLLLKTITKSVKLETVAIFGIHILLPVLLC